MITPCHEYLVFNAVMPAVIKNFKILFQLIDKVNFETCMILNH